MVAPRGRKALWKGKSMVSPDMHKDPGRTGSWWAEDHQAVYFRWRWEKQSGHWEVAMQRYPSPTPAGPH